VPRKSEPAPKRKTKAVREDSADYGTKPAGKASALLDTRVVYCGDNLEQLQKLPPACVDLIYIDPPFNSNRNYEVFWGETKEKRAFEDRHESTKAYIDYMRPRCVELARVLKKTGSFYYHCDWHASHYVKVMLDQIFGENNFVNEIVWKRSDAKSDVGQGAKHFGRVHDSIFYYAGSDTYTFNAQFTPLPQSTVDSWYKHVEESTGRRYNKADVTGPGGAAKGCPVFEWKGVTRAWRFSKANMERLEKEGRLTYSKTGMVYQKRYLDESKGVALSSWWDDIDMLRGISSGGERLGYPTQKPLKLLERILEVSSNENDIVLDAFCGCGTALVAAQKLKRSGSASTSRRRRAGSWPSGCAMCAAWPRASRCGKPGAASWCATCRGRPRSCAPCRPLSSRTGRSSPSAASPTRRRWATWASTAASSRCRRR
jgi:DNA modification methylase